MPVPPYQLPLRYRKTLATKLIFLEAAHPHVAAFNGTQPGVLQRLQTEILTRANRAANDDVGSPNSEPLDAFVDRTLECAKVHATHAESKQEKRVVLAILQSCRNAATNMRCVTCATAEDRVCRGTTRDDLAVLSTGACIGHIRQLFDFAVTVAHEYYTRYGTLYTDSVRPMVRLATENKVAVPHDMPVKLYVSGNTMFRDNSAERHSVVNLMICVSKFDWNTYCAIPYVLFHECICHAYQNLLATSLRTALEPDDPFGEGWMDWISFSVLEHIVRTRPGLLKHSRDVLEQAAEFHHARMRGWNLLSDESSQQKSQFCASYSYGKRAARKVEMMLRRLPESADRYQDDLFQLSFDLNISALTALERRHFVAVIDAYLPEEDELVLRHHQKGIKILRKYLKDKDLSSFVASLFALKPRL